MEQIRENSLCLYVKVFPTKQNFMETHNCTAYTKWGVVCLKAPSGGIFISSQIYNSGPSKKPVSFEWLVNLSGVIFVK